MTTGDPADVSVPVGPDWDRFVRLLPETAVRAAQGMGPMPRQSQETPEQAAERVALAAALRSAAYRPPVGYATAAYTDLDPTQPREVVAGWLGGDRCTLVLAGPVGTGKTHALHAVCRDAVSRGLWTLYWPTGLFLEAARPDGDPSAVRRARTCDVLALDDVGGHRASEWASDVLFNVLDARLYEKRRTVVATNRSHDEIVEVLGDRFADRLTQSMVAAKFTGPSRRRKAW